MTHLPKLCLRMSLVALFFCCVEPRALSAQTSVVHDTGGDTEFGGPPFLDVVKTQVTFQRGNGHFIFTAVMDGPIPEVSTVPFASMSWNVATESLDVDPIGTFVVRTYWNVATDGWVADLVDRRPLQTGGPPVIIGQLPFKISGRVLKVAVDSALLEYPEAFLFRAVTRVTRFPQPGVADFAPDGGAFAWWPGRR